MSNYLNQIESDLYKLYSITNGSGEVVEMVAEIKEKYEKAKAWDLLTEDINFIESEIEEIGLSQMLAVKTIGIKALKRKNEYESGEPYA